MARKPSGGTSNTASLRERLRSRRLADTSFISRLPDPVGPMAMAVSVAVVGIVVVFYLGGNYYDSEFVLAIAYAIVVVGMALQIGYSHQLAFSQSVFMGFGAYGVAILNTKYGWPTIFASIAVLFVGGFLGWIIGIFVTKVPGFALALATLFFSVIVTGVVIYSSYLGGETGLGGIAPLWSGSSYVPTLERSGGVAMLVLGLCVYVIGRIMKSGIGLELAFLGTNERMAASIGIITQRRKLEIFVLSCAIASLGGAMFAGTQAFVSTVNFNQTAQVTLLVMLFIGGRGTIPGALIGSFGIQFLSGASNFIDTNLLIIEGVLFTLVLLYAPNGAIEIFGRLGRLLVRLLVRQPTDARSEAALLRAEGEEVREPGRFGGEEGAPSIDVDPAEESKGLYSSISTEHRSLGVAGADMPAQLECRNLTKAYGGVVAVDNVSLVVRGLGISAICGPNGAGKSTLFEIVSGGIAADQGEVFIGGVDVTHMPAFARAQLGIARTLQTVRLMNNRNVLDNVTVAALPSHRTFMAHAVIHSDLRESRDRAMEALKKVGIAHMADRFPGQLTLEAQRMVELARAMVVHPKMVLLDEPASGLSVEQRARLADQLVELGEEMTVVLVEHDLQLVARIAREIFVLIDGRLEFTGDATGFMESPVVRRELMGLIEEETTV